MPGSTCARTVIAEGPVSLSGCFELEFRSTRTKSKQFPLPRDGRRRMITASFTENYQNKKRKTNYVGSWTIVQLDVLAEPETASSVDALEGCRPFTGEKTLSPGTQTLVFTSTRSHPLWSFGFFRLPRSYRERKRSWPVDYFPLLCAYSLFLNLGVSLL